MGALLPAHGTVEYIVPAFERGTFSGLIHIDGPIHCWQEHEDPYRLFAQLLEEKDLLQSTLAIDEATPFFRYDGMMCTLPQIKWRNGHAITGGCRSRKSSTELALMQRANDMTLVVQRAAARILHPGISTQVVHNFIHNAHKAVGAPGGSSFCIVLFGADTAFPHGVKQPKCLELNDMVLIDTGCQLYGYRSDITRSYVFGEASAQQRLVWNHEQGAQSAAFTAAEIGQPCSRVGNAVRQYLIEHYYGANYALPGVLHRTGHSIGLDIHESPNLVGNITRRRDVF